jgi:hypothetical protein
MIIAAVLGISSSLQHRVQTATPVTASLPAASNPVSVVPASTTPLPSPTLNERPQVAPPQAAYVVPVVDSISFPATMRADGSNVYGTVSFHDDNSDVIKADFRVISGDFQPFSFDPRVRGQRRGQFGFYLWCNRATDATMLVSLQDAQGHLSDSKAFSFQCVDTTSQRTTTSTTAAGVIGRFTTDRSSYTINDPITIYFHLARDSYVYLFDHTASHQWLLIFPNAYDSNNKLTAGYHVLPRPGTSSWIVNGPPGHEDIYLITVEAPLAYVPQPPPGAGSLDLLGWFLKRLTSSQWDYAATSFTVRSY